MTLETGRRYRVFLASVSKLPSFDGRYVGPVVLAGAVRGHEFSTVGTLADGNQVREWRPILLLDEIRSVEELADAA